MLKPSAGSRAALLCKEEPDTECQSSTKNFQQAIGVDASVQTIGKASSVLNSPLSDER